MRKKEIKVGDLVRGRKPPMPWLSGRNSTGVFLVLSEFRKGNKKIFVLRSHYPRYSERRMEARSLEHLPNKKRSKKWLKK